jgi:hypothetical protein
MASPNDVWPAKACVGGTTKISAGGGPSRAQLSLAISKRLRPALGLHVTSHRPFHTSMLSSQKLFSCVA